MENPDRMLNLLMGLKNDGTETIVNLKRIDTILIMEILRNIHMSLMTMTGDIMKKANGLLVQVIRLPYQQ